MAGRPKWGEEDRARVYVILTANAGNVKRTAREAQVPENTVRRWKQEWEREGPPVGEVVEKTTDSFLEAAEIVRNDALVIMHAKLPEAKVGELNAVVGTLTDKINLIRGAATSRQEHTFALPSPEELSAVLGPAVQRAIQMAEERQDEIIDAEVVEVRALPRPS